VGENGTIYCCWLWNVYNCEHEETFQSLALVSGILSLIAFLVLACLTAWVYFDKRLVGTKRFASFLFLADATLFFLFIHVVALYTNAYHNSPYGFLVLTVCVGILALALFTFGTEIVAIQSEITAFDRRSIIIRFKRFFHFWAIFARLVATSISIIFCHYLNVNSDSAETAFKALAFSSAVEYFLFSSIIIQSIFPLFMRMDDLAASNRASLRASATSAVTFSSQFFIAEKQMKMTKVTIFVVLLIIIGVMSVLVVTGATEQIFKTDWLSSLLFCLIGIVDPIMCIMTGIMILVFEFQKKALSRNAIRLRSSLLTDTNQSIMVNEDLS